ncbi:MAG: SRPBCC family protein [Bacteroidales bacterium]|nr:SRPBCC family protein [Bacteroidales bacterium]MDE7466441.1 SRPBCC family protein [Muribaculaceae bacterium]
MAEYKSEEVGINAPAQKVYDKLSNLEGLKELLAQVPEDSIPADQKDLFNQVKITSDTISFPAGPVGDLTLRKTRCEAPVLIRLEGVSTPVPISLTLHISPVTEISCTAQVDIDLQIPAMLKPMVNGPLKKMTEQFAQMLRHIPFE